MNKSNLLRAWRVMSWALIFFISVPVQVLTLAPVPAIAVALPKIEICHATNSETNPYNSQSVDKNATAGGHDGDTGGVYPASPWGDIIPPYTYYINEQTGEDCETIIDTPAVPASGPILYTKNSDFNHANIEIDYQSSDKRIKITPKNGYYIISVSLDINGDGIGGYVDHTSDFPSSGGTYDPDGPSGDDTIESAKVTIYRDAVPAVTHEECEPIYEDVAYEYPGKNWTEEGQAIYNNDCEIPTYCGDGEKNGTEECDGDDGVGEHQDCGAPEAENACQLIDLPYCGDSEVNQESEQCDNGEEGSETCSNTCETIEPEDPITILAWKVVCDTESALPDWGLSGGVEDDEPSVVGPTTALDYVAASDGHCWLESDWNFQWGPWGQLMDGDYVGSASTEDGWNDFSSVTSGTSTPAQVQIEDWDDQDRIWLREVLKEGYIPFVNPPGDNQNPTSAEFYCGDDILNFDNWEWVSDLQHGNTYYCVAFNVPVGCGNGIVEGEEQCDDGPAGSNECSPQCATAPACDPEVELITNGGFESPVVTASAKWDIFPSNLTSWLTEWVSTSPNTFGAQTRPEEAWLELHRKVSGWLPSEGEQYAELDGDWYGPTSNGNGEPASTKIKQNLATWPGYEYEVSFDFSPRPSTGTPDNKIDFSWDGGLVATVFGTGGSNTVWTNHVYSLTATDFDTEILFADAGNANSLGSFLDNVSVRCLPPVVPVCGDGEVNQESEICDDGNTEDGDGCDAQCQPEEIYADYCGDGEVNQEWEQCDGDQGCNQYCQWEEQNECNDLVLARVNFDEVKNWGNGDMTSDIFLGSAGNKIPAGTWFALFDDGVGIIDADLSGYEDVAGLAVQRLNGSVRTVIHGTGVNNDKEHIHGNIEFYNATVIDQDDDPSNALPGGNRLENGFNGTGTTQYNAGNDEVWISDATHSNFWLTVTTADDGFYSDWLIIEDCIGQICGYKYNDKDENGSWSEGDEGLEDWTIELLQFSACETGEEWADSVVSYDKGNRRNGTPVVAERTDPAKALGVAQNNDTINFVALGFGGELILAFDNLIVNEAGNDVQVVETTFGNQVCNTYPEKADVYASQNGLDWTYLGNACLDASFDLGDLSWAQYIKVIDTTSLSDFNSVPEADGYDVDGVKALNCASEVTVVETQLTDETGHYCFETTTPGDYRVQEEMQSNWQNTSAWFVDVSFNGEDGLEVDFFNATEEQAPQGSICGYKFYDNDQDGLFNNNDYGIDGWKIFGLGNTLTSTYTNENGEYCLNALEAGTWDVFEELFTLPGNWATTTVATRTIELTSEGVIGINFGNILCTDEDGDGWAANGGAICGEQDCDDDFYDKSNLCDNPEVKDNCVDNDEDGYYVGEDCGDVEQDCNDEDFDETNSCESGESCVDEDEDGYYVGESCVEVSIDCDDSDSAKTTDCSNEEEEEEEEETPPGGGGGGGGGGNFSNLIIHTESTGQGEGSLSVLISWFTNKPATSRVVYDTVSHPEAGEAPNYGYQWSTPQTDTDPKVTYHQVLITGLNPNTIYYFRPISSASPEVLGTEISYQILENGEVIIEETAPEQEIPTGSAGGSTSGTGTSGAGNSAAAGIVAGAEFEEPTLLAQAGDTLPTQQPDQNEPDANTSSTTPSATNCAMYIWLLLVVNTIAIAVMAYFGMNASSSSAKQAWWILAILAVVPTVLGYAQCWLVIWLLITLVISIILYFSLIKRKN